jgi:ABC-type sugar transport system, periplasmic component
MKKKVLATILTVAMMTTMMAGCGSTPAKSGDAPADAETTTEGTTNETVETVENTGEEVTIKVFSNLPDRKNGQGLVEQLIIEDYMKENPHITIEVEALDEEAYKTKFKAYAMEGMPDLVSVWGHPSFLNEVLEAGVLAELNKDDYKDYGFFEGSLEGFSKDGKLFGLPRNSDIMGIYYNEKMFNDNGWEIPKSYEELLTLGETIKEAGIIPMAMDGGDGWPLAIWYSDMLMKITGGYADLALQSIADASFTDPAFTEAAEYLAQASERGLWQNGYDSQDYGTAMNLFTNGQAAMFYMGSWEASMAINEDIPQEIRDNIRVFTMPVIDGGKGSETGILAWNGGGYGISSNSQVEAEVLKLLNYIYLPEKLSKYGWENGVGMSAQDQTAFMTGNETILQKQFLEILNGSTKLSGTTINDLGTANFKTVIESEIQGMSNGTTSPADFLAILDESLK